MDKTLEKNAIQELKKIRKAKEMFKKLYGQSQNWDKEENEKLIDQLLEKVRAERMKVDEKLTFKQDRVEAQLINLDASLLTWVKDANKAYRVVDERVMEQEREMNLLRDEEEKNKKMLSELAQELRVIQATTRKIREAPEVQNITKLENEIDKMKVKHQTASNIGEVYDRLKQQMESKYKEYGIVINQLETTLRDKYEHVQELEQMLRKGAKITERAKGDMEVFMQVTTMESHKRELELNSLKSDHDKRIEREKEAAAMMNKANQDAGQEAHRRRELNKEKRTVEDQLDVLEKQWKELTECFQVIMPQHCPEAFRKITDRLTQLTKKHEMKDQQLTQLNKEALAAKRKLDAAKFGPETKTMELNAKIDEVKSNITDMSGQASKCRTAAAENRMHITEIGNSLVETFDRLILFEIDFSVPPSRSDQGQMVWIKDLVETYRQNIKLLESVVVDDLKERFNSAGEELLTDPEFLDWVDTTYGEKKAASKKATATAADSHKTEEENSLERKDSAATFDEAGGAKGILTREELKREGFHLLISLLRRVQASRPGGLSKASMHAFENKQDRREITQTTMMDIKAELGTFKVKLKK